MGWLYMQSLNGHATPKAYLDNQLTHVSGSREYRVLKSAAKATVYYAAVEKVENGQRAVFAVVCLYRYRKHGFTDGMIFGYKDMDESMGPFETECPAAILDLLTPTTVEYAVKWREACRKRLAKRLPKPGETFTLATPLTFTDKVQRGTFTVERYGSKTYYRASDGICVRISRLKDRDFTIAEKAAA